MPSSTLTQLGIYGNGRFFTNVLNALKSGELEEEKEKGFEFEAELKKVIPTFIKRNKEDERVRSRDARDFSFARGERSDAVPEGHTARVLPRGELPDRIFVRQEQTGFEVF